MMNPVLSLIKALRRNHAIEHATTAVLMTKIKAGARLMGLAVPDGFYIYGDVSPETVSQSAEEGLSRLKHGEHDLAVSPLCGTNFAVAALLAGIASTIVFRKKRGGGELPTAILASLTAIILAQPLGRFIQKNVTTSTDVSNVQIDEVSSSISGRLTRHKIKTLQG